MIATSNSRNQPVVEMSLDEAIEMHAKLAQMISDALKGNQSAFSIAVAFEVQPGQFSPSNMHFKVSGQ